MMFSKKSDGFTLIEALIALVVMGLVFTPIYIAQSTTIYAVSVRALLLERIMHAKQFMFDTHSKMAKEQRSFSQEKKIKNPPTTLKFTLAPLAADSVLHRFKGLLLETVTIQWQQNGKPKTDQLSSIIFKPEPEVASP